RSAEEWFEALGSGAAAFCRLTQQGFLRLATTPKVLADEPLTLIQAWQLYDELFGDPRVVFSEEPDELEKHWRGFTRRRTFSPKERGLSLLRCLEPANRLVSSLQGEALNRLREGACPAAAWPWGNLSGEEVLRLLWGRLMAPPAVAPTVRQ